ncbi:putative short-chain dehydrogenase reductase family [Rosellinia necatrix]|uniref:Putative short-chain dehydrogenase reductase family n=1 Tax=Rosellinia necatrix TaxID=77044 RepID=A0A1W2TU32_ROSNE|nr:putative short-chain dehydrogenase reductase family [Rosellinia necatrix]
MTRKKGIGAAVARAFARAGCSRLVLADVKPLSATEAAVLEIDAGARVLCREGDVADEAFAGALAADARAAFGRLDYVVNCAGVLGPAAPLRSHETPPAAYARVMDVNVRGTWLVSRAALAVMLAQDADHHPGQRGAIVNIASQLGIVARPAAAPYCASKAAVINLTRSDAIDYSRDGIRVNCVCPGLIETPMTTGSPEVEERMRSAVDMAPMGRMGQPDEIADAVLFLCSSQSSFIQGHALVVDGGYTIN